MPLSQTEKLMLANQYEILKRLNPSEQEHYDLLLNCLYQGYDQDFEDLIPHFEPPIPEETRQEVREILQMFRALYPEQTEGKRLPPAVFAGFDGNEEGEHYSYARFLIESRGLWGESKTTSYNSHTNMLPTYRRMLQQWNLSLNKYQLTHEEIQKIVEIAPHMSRVGANLSIPTGVTRPL